MDILENVNELGNKLNNDLKLENLQNLFLDTTIGRIANSAIDLGLKIILPDYMENEVIEVKDALITGGIKEGITTAVENAIEIGKKIVGMENLEFKNLKSAQNALIEGNVIGGISNSLDLVLDKAKETNIIPENITTIIKEGKNVVLKNISSNINKEFEQETKALNKLEKYIDNWKNHYKNKNIDGLNNEYKKIEKQMNKILPLENIIKNVNIIRNINELIQNSDQFDFKDIYLDLAESF